MAKINNFLKNQQGSPAIEFAILSPLLFMMLFGAFELSRYIMAVRKVENAVNDIALVLSREGTIYDLDGNGATDPDIENAGRLDNLVNAMMPILTFPFSGNSYEVEITAIARPVGAAIAPNNLRIMWQHKVAKTAAGGSSISVSTTTPNITSGSTNVSGSAQPTSIYSDNYGQRAELAFAGDTFILAKAAISYSDPLGWLKSNTAIDLSGGRIEKIASYAARKRWFDDGDRIIQANEVYNQMQICTNCSELSSNALGGGNGRQKCIDPVPIGSKTGGCEFNQ